jgi:hypothetical protein
MFVAMYSSSRHESMAEVKKPLACAVARAIRGGRSDTAWQSGCSTLWRRGDMMNAVADAIDRPVILACTVLHITDAQML